MKRLAITAIAAGCMAAVVAVAQVPEKAHTETTTKQTGPGPDIKTKAETVTGTVKEYEAGKKIKLSGPANKTYSFDLDGNAQVNGAIVVGQMAKVTYSKTADGTEKVSVLSEATHDAQMAATAPKMHSESTVKESAPGVDTKTKSEVVIGVVKAYEPGKTIKITGPKDKNYSFDLDEQAAMKGSVSVGDRVKVTYTKTDGGQKVTTVEPWKS
ncbi:MAG TPA: hypothetical protein VN032_10215 [Thermoanaerobaculia bacterium]|jgi:hypothetical protein|nr:hypothetical protein [Thermoanaerobaculia bacterium]